MNDRLRCIADVGDGWLVGKYHQSGPAMFFETSIEIERFQRHDPVDPVCPRANDPAGRACGQGQGHGAHDGGAAGHGVQDPKAVDRHGHLQREAGRGIVAV